MHSVEDVRMHVDVDICIFMYMTSYNILLYNMYVYVHVQSVRVCMYVRTYVCMYVCMYVYYTSACTLV